MNASGSIASIDSCAKQKQQRQHLSALCKHKYRTDYHRHGPMGIVRPLTSKVVILGAIAVTTLIIAGCTMNSFSLDIMGIIGIAVESGQGFSQAKTYHNLFSLAGVILEQARFLDTGRYYLGLGTLACLLIATTLFVPILQVWVPVRQWLAPLSQRADGVFTLPLNALPLGNMSKFTLSASSSRVGKSGVLVILW